VTTAGRPDRALDYGLAGLVTIRLVSPPPHIIADLEETLGPSRETPPGVDIVVEFVDSIPFGEDVRMLELNEAAFDSASFYILSPEGSRTRIDFEQIGAPLEVVCERGVRSIPLLLPIIGLRLLEKGHVLLHSASFLSDGRSFIAAGWKKGGKTELLLAHLARGALYLSDEWSIVSGDGTVRGVPGAIRVWDWHLRDLPELRGRVDRRTRARLAMLGHYRRLYPKVPKSRVRGGVLRERFERLALEGGVPWLGQVAVRPEQLFPGQVSAATAKLDVVILPTIGEGQTTALPTTGELVAQRMVASQEYERRELRAVYDQFRFAFPDRRNALLEGAGNRELQILTSAFADRDALELRHPYPVSLQELYDATLDGLASER
jgi:hypothetical protein